jgi:hypothetical protein
MSNKLKKETEKLVTIIKCYPNGVSIEELLHIINDLTPRRTVQYRLSSLVKSGILRIEGRGRNSKYYINHTNQSKSSESAFKIPLSLEGEKLRNQISAPIQMRKHISYRREFLDSYEPNTTS